MMKMDMRRMMEMIMMNMMRMMMMIEIQVVDIYYKEMAQLLKKATGAEHVEMFHHQVPFMMMMTMVLFLVMMVILMIKMTILMVLLMVMIALGDFDKSHGYLKRRMTFFQKEIMITMNI